MTEPMRPADVDQALVDLAVGDGQYGLTSNGLWGGWERDQAEREIRSILAAVLPLHAKQLGERLGKLTFPCPGHTRPAFDPTCPRCHRYTALLGARRTIEGTDSEPAPLHQPDPADTITKALTDEYARGWSECETAMRTAVVDATNAYRAKVEEQINPRIDEATDTISRLRTLAEEILSNFVQTGYPGYAAKRTHWIRADQIDTWRAQIYTAPQNPQTVTTASNTGCVTAPAPNSGDTDTTCTTEAVP